MGDSAFEYLLKVSSSSSSSSSSRGKGRMGNKGWCEEEEREAEIGQTWILRGRKDDWLKDFYYGTAKDIIAHLIKARGGEEGRE